MEKHPSHAALFLLHRQKESFLRRTWATSYRARVSIISAINPAFAVEFLQYNGIHGFPVLDAVFAVATGAEALYADMGHFGKHPIPPAWALLVMPSLLPDYFDQGALLPAYPALIQSLRHNRILHSETAFFHFRTEDTPWLPSLEKIEIEKRGGFYKVIAHYGFTEELKIENALTLAHERGLEFKLKTTSFSLGREKITLPSRSRMSG